MVEITKTNQRDERKQVSDALTTNASNIATNTTNITNNDTDISALDARITTLEGGVNGTPPTSLLGRATTNAELQTDVELLSDAAIIVQASSSTYNVWFEVAGQAATNPGVITFLSVSQEANANNLDAGARLTIDGGVVWSTDNDFWKATTDNNDGAYIIGGRIESGGSKSAESFVSSWSLECRINENSAGTFTARSMTEWHI